MSVRRERRAPSPVTVVLASAALALVGNLATNTVQVAWASWPMLVWGVTILLLAMVARIEIRRARAGAAELVDALTGAVRARYRHLVVQYGVNQPMPLRVRWSSTGRPVAAAREVVLGDTSGARWELLPLEGDVRGIVTAFLALPHRQLMVLGEAGAGKSVLATLLAAGLLESVKDHGVLPVLIPLASWDPGEPVADFTARRIQEDYLASADRAAVARLLDDGKLLPILDGLDELPADTLGTAVRALDNFAATGCPLVVTCRGLPYEQAVKSSGTLLSRAAVVEIEPVGGQDVIEFLSHPEPVRGRWEPVFREIREHGDGPLARALSTPLMVSLARTVYRAPGQDPGELVHLPDRDAVERLLLDQFVPAAYAELEGLSGRRGRRYRPEQAARWLSYLALQMFHSGTRTLRWWELWAGHFWQRVPPFLLGILAVVLLAVLVTGVIAGSAPLVVVSLLPMVCVLPGGLGGLLAGPLLGWRLDAIWVGVVGGVIMWAAMGTLPTWWNSIDLRRATLVSVLRTYRLRAMMAFIQRGLLALLAFGVPAWFLRPDRLPAMATAAAVVFAVAGASQGGLAVRLLFRANHLVMVAGGWLPLRLIAFLDDARERGLLRHVGAELQFRHIMVQDHLAARAETDLLRRSKVTDQLILRLAEEGRTLEVLAMLPALDGIAVDRTARTALAATLATTGHIRQAVEVLETFHGRPSPATFRLGVLLARLRHDELAIEVLDPGEEEGDWSSLPLAEVLARHGRFDEAVTALRRGDIALPNMPDRTAARYGELLALAGRRAEAIGYLSARAATKGETLETRRVLLRLLAEDDDGAEQLREAAERGDVAAMELLAERACADGDAQTAVTYLEPLVLEHGQHERLVQLVESLQDLDQLDRAIAVVEGLDTNHRSCLLLCDLLIDAGRVEEAEQLLRDHEHPISLATLIGWLGRLDEALEVLRKVAGEDWRIRMAKERRADLLADHDRVDQLRALAPADTFAAQRLAELLERDRQPQEARQVLDPERDDDKIPLAGLLSRHGDVDEAIALLRPLLAHPSLAVQAAGPLADLHTSRGETDRAVAVLRKGIIAGDGDTLGLEEQLSVLLRGEAPG